MIYTYIFFFFILLSSNKDETSVLIDPDSTSCFADESAPAQVRDHVDAVHLLSPDSTSTPFFTGGDGEQVSSGQEQDCGVGVNTSETLSRSQLVYFLPPPDDAPLSVKKAFLSQHPIQPEPTGKQQKFNFNPSKAYFKTTGSTVQKREWLSYNVENSSFYCSTCMAFSPIPCSRNQSKFTKGFNVIGRKDIYRKIEQREVQESHLRAVSACAAALGNEDISTLIDCDLANEKMSQTKLRRAIVERITHLCIFIGRQGIAFRGNDESASSLDDRSLNHGNFLELMLLVSEFDPVLKQHIALCTQKAKQRQKSCKGQKGRGSFVTFFSKTSLNKLIRIIGNEIQAITINAVKEAVYFSIQIDSTQDTRVLDQLCITIRYVDSTGPKEKLFRLLVSHDNSGEGIFNLLKLELSKVGLLTELAICLDVTRVFKLD